MQQERLTPKAFVLGFQHLFAMFGATVLVPFLTGLDPSIALIGAGCGTIIFHLITKRKVPVFLGSSFAFIGGICAVTQYGMEGVTSEQVFQNIPKVQGGVIVAGAIYLVFALLVYLIGTKRIKKIFPPVVTGPIIMLIGLNLSPTAISMASQNWWIAIVVMLVVILISVFDKGFFKLVPVLIGIAAGYLLCLILDATHLYTYLGAAQPFIDFTSVKEATWFFDFKKLQLPQFDFLAITTIAPIAIVSFMEHIGDITTNGAVVGQDFYKDPGLHRTLMGDGIATMFAGLIGAPANTTYGENTGVLAVTKMYDPRILRIAACYAIIMGLIGKLGAILQTIPQAVMGGICIILFGMIASIGLRTIKEADLDFKKSRNLMIITLILALGMGIGSNGATLHIFGVSITFSALFIATLVGIVANLVLPENV